MRAGDGPGSGGERRAPRISRAARRRALGPAGALPSDIPIAARSPVSVSPCF